MTTAEIPATYNPTKGCFAEGLPLFWKGACVGYDVNRAGSTNIPLDVAQPIIDQAFATWSNVTCSGTKVGITASDLGPVDCAEVRYNPEGPNQNVIVFRDGEWPYNDPNNTLGLTTVTFFATTGEIYDADMEINATGANLSTSEQVPVGGYDLLSVVTHEAGHFLGLAHATSPTSTMYASYKPGSSSLRDLSEDDIAGVCSIYPNDGERNVSDTVSANGVIAATACDPAPRHGFSSSCAAAPTTEEPSSSCTVASGLASRSSSRFGGVAALLGGAGVALVGWSRRRRSRAR